MTDDAILTGGCFCGALRYEIHAPLVMAQACHCSRCRKVFSGTGSAFGFLAEGSFRWSGEPTALSRFATEDGWSIGFCGTCGTTLCGIHGDVVRGVTLGPIDGDPGIQLARHIYVDSRAPWDHIGGDVPQFPEAPPD
ncbi:MAG: GFA family protein [Sandaracinaceae bacterium]